MKGPYQRLRHDLRRHWECPVCGHRVTTSGAETSALCKCQQAVPPATRRYMRLLEGNTRRRFPGEQVAENPSPENPTPENPVSENDQTADIGTRETPLGSTSTVPQYIPSQTDEP